MRSRLAAALVVVGVLVGLASAAHAAQGRTPREAALFDGQRTVTVQPCGVDASVTVLAVLTGTTFDSGARVTFTVDAPAGIEVRGDAVEDSVEWPVSVRVGDGTAPGTYEVHAMASGVRDGLPADVADAVRVLVAC